MRFEIKRVLNPLRLLTIIPFKRVDHLRGQDLCSLENTAGAVSFDLRLAS